MEWQQFAACKDAPDPDLFHRRDCRALEFCIGCPVVKECGEFAAAEGLVGWWGGRFIDGMPKRQASRAEEFTHGTYAGARRHYRADEPPCEECQMARREYNRTVKRGGKTLEQLKLEAREGFYEDLVFLLSTECSLPELMGRLGVKSWDTLYRRVHRTRPELLARLVELNASAA